MKKIVLILMASLLFVTPAMAADKIGSVDMQKALNETKAGAAAKQEVEALVQQYTPEINSKQAAFAEKKKNYEQQAPLLAGDAKASQEAELQREFLELQRYRNEIEQKVKKLDAEHTRRIVGELRDILAEIGKKGKYTAIFDVNEGGLFYLDSDIDVTDELIKKHNAKN